MPGEPTVGARSGNWSGLALPGGTSTVPRKTGNWNGWSGRRVRQSGGCGRTPVRFRRGCFGGLAGKGGAPSTALRLGRRCRRLPGRGLSSERRRKDQDSVTLPRQHSDPKLQHWASWWLKLDGETNGERRKARNLCGLDAWGARAALMNCWGRVSGDETGSRANGVPPLLLATFSLPVRVPVLAQSASCADTGRHRTLTSDALAMLGRGRPPTLLGSEGS